MNLVEIIYALTLTEARMPAKLPRGLHLVHYPAGDGQPARLIAARHITSPSPAELRIVHDALLAALDLHQARVVTVIGDWEEHSRGDWNGYQIAYTMQSATDAFSPDPDTRQRIRLALEQRDARIEKRREKVTGNRKPASPNRKPML